MTSAEVAPAANKPPPPMVMLRDRLLSRRDELKAALGDIPVEAFVRAVVTSAQINPDILACSWSSIWLSCMRACRDGLLLDGVEAALVPYKETASYIPMYQGQLRKFRRSGQFKWITAGLVRKGEEFSHHIDENGEHFLHVPGDDFQAPIEKIYALATTKDGGVFAAVLAVAEANKIKAMSKATRDDSPWRMWPEEMYKKTALRRLSKMLPSARDNIAFDDDEPIGAIPQEPEGISHVHALHAQEAQTLDQIAAPKTKADAGAADKKPDAAGKSG